MKQSADDGVGEADESTDLIGPLLRSVRQRLGMEVAFIGELSAGMRIFRYVDQEVGSQILAVGDADPAENSFCGHVLAGRLPNLLIDPQLHPVAAALPVTAALPVGTHVSVPIRFSNGRVYGTFCCFSTDVHTGLDDSHVAMVRVLADIAAEQLEGQEVRRHAERSARDRIMSILRDRDAIHMVFQPLRDLRTDEVVAVEALARFPGVPEGPEWAFSQAARHGVGIEMELRAVGAALAALPEIPPGVRLNVNVSGDTVTSDRFMRTVSDLAVPEDRLVVEVTEHAMIDDYSQLQTVRRALEQRGVRLSIDDVGTGWSGLRRILESRPHQLKLDATLIGGVQGDPTRQALVDAIVTFARRAGAEVVAEGIEHDDELRDLRARGVHVGQGYYLGRPGPLVDALAAADVATSR